MSTLKSRLPDESRNCQVTVDGKVDPSWSDWLGGATIRSHTAAGGRILTTLHLVLPDQAALRGLLNRLWDLNLVVRSVQWLDPAVDQDKEQGGSHEDK